MSTMMHAVHVYARVPNDIDRPTPMLLPANLKTRWPLTQVKEKEKELRILILGLDNAGKTTILKYVQAIALSSFDPTVSSTHHIFISKGSFAASASTPSNQRLDSTSKPWSTRVTN